MREFLRGCSLVACAVVGLFGVTTDVTAQGAIAGRVTSVDNGRPVVSAYVQVDDETGRRVATGLTNQDGAYRIQNIAPGTYTVTASAAGYTAGTTPAVTVQTGQTANANLSLETAVFQLSEVVATVSKRVEKALEAPARTEVIGATELENRPTPTVVDHMRDIAAVDVISQGLQSTNVVVRGFNNIFSGALHTLTDNRIAGVPSLRVNVLNFIPSTNEDLERIEIVLGPGSALYGPNTANGVLHMITKSPLDEPYTSISLAGGERSVVLGSFRTSQHFSENLGFKVSGQYFGGNEWEYTDPVEAAEKTKFASDPFWKQDLMLATGISSEQADRRIARIGNRDFDLERWSGEARMDWRASPDLRTVFSIGRSNASQIEATGLGAAQAQDWTYTFYQARANYRRLFVQGYLNASDAGDTYLLRNGTPIVDRSKLWVGQVQHGFDLGQRQTFTYGTDILYTNPETEGTINGKYEDDDKTTEIGVYLQSETALSPKFDLVLAGRMDDHTALPDPVFSPRAGLVFKPADNQSFRVTYNRAFSTPSSLNQFLDLPTAAPVPSLARLGFSVRVQGTGDTGFRFAQSNGSYLMRSPFTPGGLGGPAQLLPADVTPFWRGAVQVAAAQAAQAGSPIDPQLLQYLLSLTPTAAQIGTNYLNPTNGQTGELAALVLPDIDPIKEETSSTFEVGYQGQLGDRFVLAADVWFSKRKDLITPLTTQTPLLLLNGPATGQFLVTRLVTDLGMSPQQAAAIAGQLAPGLAMIPLGVISSADVNANGAQLLASYTNVNADIDLWGADITATILLSDRVALNASTSLVNDDLFEYVVGSDTTSVPLNAPKFKMAGSVAYRDPARPFGGELRLRYTDGFPANSGVYQGTACIEGSAPALTIEPCVESYTLVDVVANYRLPFAPGASLDLSVQNLFDTDYRSFPGVPDIGRFAMLRLRYEF
ncbi:MAG: TonB-dependent receptor domain-containing protein [Longimicrobiales bacterium]